MYINCNKLYFTFTFTFTFTFSSSPSGRERGHWGDQDVDGRIILRWIFRKLAGGRGDWMELAQDRDR